MAENIETLARLYGRAGFKGIEVTLKGVAKISRWRGAPERFTNIGTALGVGMGLKAFTEEFNRTVGADLSDEASILDSREVIGSRITDPILRALITQALDVASRRGVLTFGELRNIDPKTMMSTWSRIGKKKATFLSEGFKRRV